VAGFQVATEVLREAELVTCERRGTWVYYQLAPDAMRRVEAAIATIFKGKLVA
jgi:DNA-binding transcriptional ArsR family regulator